MLKKLLRIPREEITFAKRRFLTPRDSIRRHLERVGESFLHGYHVALADEGLNNLATRLAEVEVEFRGFAYEGAAMAFDLLDQLMPWRSPRLAAYLDGIGAPHTYMIHVGIGWSMARWPLRFERRFLRLDPLLCWLALDGYGFHEGYFHWPRYASGTSWPRRASGYGRRAFDQGLGRSLWFVGGADPDWIAKAVAAFSESRHADLWSGVGLACAYAGGVDAADIHRLRVAAMRHATHLAQGACFAAGARERAGNPSEHTELACRLLCGFSAQEAAAVCDETRLQAQDDSQPAYEVWRWLIRMNLARRERQRKKTHRKLSTKTGVPEAELENAQ